MAGSKVHSTKRGPEGLGNRPIQLHPQPTRPRAIMTSAISSSVFCAWEEAASNSLPLSLSSAPIVDVSETPWRTQCRDRGACSGTFRMAHLCTESMSSMPHLRKLSTRRLEPALSNELEAPPSVCSCRRWRRARESPGCRDAWPMQTWSRLGLLVFWTVHLFPDIVHWASRFPDRSAFFL